jgi:prepilin-type N-terminal cleavage/methylation domain-containing protein
MRLRDEHGFSLIELLVAMSIFMVAIGASFTLVDAGSRAAPREESRADAVKTAQVQLDRMSRELRQAVRITSSSYNFVDFSVVVAGQTRRVLYDCRGPGTNPSTRSCKRSEGPVGGALGPSVIVVDNLLNGTDDPEGRVFTADDPLQPRFVEVRIEIAAGGGARNGYAHHLVLDDGVYLRNLDLS